MMYTDDEKDADRNASTAGFKNIYARTLMKTMSCFCVEPCKNLSFGVLAPAPKVYDNIYQENRWHTYFEVLKTIHTSFFVKNNMQLAYCFLQMAEYNETNS